MRRIVSGESKVKFLKKFKENPELQKLIAKIIDDLDYTFALGSLLNIRNKFSNEIKEINKKLMSFSKSSHKWSLDNIFPLLYDFEREALSTKNIGELLFYQETEKSLGLLQTLTQSYDIILMNPPYGTLPDYSKEYVKKNYRSKDQEGNVYSPTHDYYAAFIMRCYDSLKKNGFLGMLTPRSHLFLKSFIFMRNEFFQQHLIPEITIDLGFGILDEATTRNCGNLFKKNR